MLACGGLWKATVISMSRVRVNPCGDFTEKGMYDTAVFGVTLPER